MKFFKKLSSCRSSSSASSTDGKEFFSAWAKRPEPVVRTVPEGLKIFVLCTPQLGDLLFKIKPASFCSLRCAIFCLHQAAKRSVWSSPEAIIVSRISLSCLMSCIGGRGTFKPHSTSGQTGTNSTRWPRISMRKASRFCAPSYLTFFPIRQALMPIFIVSAMEDRVPNLPGKRQRAGRSVQKAHFSLRRVVSWARIKKSVQRFNLPVRRLHGNS